MVFGVRSIRVFSNFSLDPYYEPLPWFMILSVIPSTVHYKQSSWFLLGYWPIGGKVGE